MFYKVVLLLTRPTILISSQSTELLAYLLTNVSIFIYSYGMVVPSHAFKMLKLNKIYGCFLFLNE